MKKPRHSAFADKIFSLYLHHLFRRHFAAFYRLEDMPEINPEYPLLVLANHSSWWDGFFLYYLNHNYFRRRMFLMMLEEQLQNYSFFRRLGAYGIDPKDFRAIRESLRFTSSILNGNSGKNVLVGIFPQGELLPWGAHPFKFKRGIDLILRDVKTTITILPMAMRIEMLSEQRPEVFFLSGKPELFRDQKTALSQYWQRQLLYLMKKLAEQINRGEKGTTIYRGSLSVNNRVTKISRRLYHS